MTKIAQKSEGKGEKFEKRVLYILKKLEEEQTFSSKKAEFIGKFCNN